MKLEPLIAYKGNFDVKRVDSLIQELDEKKSSMKPILPLWKKVYSISVELLTNIERHVRRDLNHPEFHSMFSLIGDNELFVVRSGNLIDEKEKRTLEERLDYLNALSFDQIKKEYFKRVTNAEISPKGGAGLGLITIAKSSKKRMEYSFESIDEGIYFFELKVFVS